MEFKYSFSPQFSLAEAWDLLVQNPGDTATAFILLGITLLLLWLIQERLLGISFGFRRLTLPSLLLDAYVIIMLPPSIVWFLVSSDSIRYTNLVAVDLAPVLLLLGVWMANISFHFSPATVPAFLNAQLAPRRQDHFFERAQKIMLVLSLLIVVLYLATARVVPLVASVQDYGAFDADPFRHSVYSLPEPLIFAYAVAVRLFLPFCVLYSFFMTRLYGKAYRLKFWAILIFALVAASLSLERSPTLGLFMVLLLAYPFTSKKNLLVRYVALSFVALLVGGLIHQAQYQLKIEKTGVVDYMSSFLLNRIWIDPSFMTAVAFREFNGSTGFLGGKSIRLLSLVGVPYQSFSSIGFVGDLWANFGWIGVVAGSVGLGFVLQWIQGKMFRSKTLSVLVIYVLLLVNTLWLLYGSILSTMVVTVFVAGVLLLRALPGAGALTARRNLLRRSLSRGPQVAG